MKTGDGATHREFESHTLRQRITATLIQGCGYFLFVVQWQKGGDRLNKTVFDKKADVEVLFEFIGTRKHPATDGYRPHHLVTDNYLTTGIHHYYDVHAVPPSGTAKGTITFLAPEAYPHCLWVGKRINIQEGDRIVGYATILKILNSLLLREHNE